MGIFFDECSVCHNKVRKTARFCNHCGTAAPGGWWKCPSCKKWIGNDSQYCPHCNTPLYPEQRADLAGGVWQKEHARFAERFEVGDVKRILVDGLQIQEGTVAILLDAGRVSDVLSAGRHTPDGVLRKINWFGNPPPRSVIMVDAGEIAVPVSVEGLRTADPFPIEFYGEVIVRFKGDKDAARAFISNFMKENRTLEYADISNRIQPHVMTALSDMCATTTLEDLVRDPERRIRLHERMTTELKAEFEACGIEVVRVSSAEFTGDEYEDFIEKRSELDIERRAIEYRTELRKMTDQESMSQYKDMDALRQYKETIDHEYRVSDETRKREFELLKREWEHDDIRHNYLLELEAQEQKHIVEKNETDHKILINKLEAEARWWEQVGDAETAAKVREIASRQQIKEETDWLEVKRLKQDLEMQRKAKAAEILKSMTFEQMLAFEDDPEKREDLIKLHHMQLQSKMSAQQILATLGKSDHNDEYVAKMAELYRETADRADRNFSRIVDPLRVGVGGNIFRDDRNTAYENKNQPNFRP